MAIVNRLFYWLVAVTAINMPVYADSSTATATVTYNVQPIDTIAISGNPGTLTISTCVPGSNPTDSNDSTTTYSITSNSTTARSIQASLNSSLPTGLALHISLQAPSGATSAGTVALSTSNATLVSGIQQVSEASLTVTYTLCATPSAAVDTSNPTITVTYTLS